LRCTFGGRSIVPDVAVIAWNRINLNQAGEPEDDFREAPDWTIEILSPDQKVNRVIDNILHCLKHGSKLGWMLDPDDYSVLMFTPQQEPEVCRGDHQLKVIAGVQLTLTPQQIFAWLKLVKLDKVSRSLGRSTRTNLVGRRNSIINGFSIINRSC